MLRESIGTGRRASGRALRNGALAAIGLLFVGFTGCASVPDQTQAATQVQAAIPAGQLTAPVAYPKVAIVCPASAAGPWSWYRVPFVHAVTPGPTRVVRYDIDYGDGRTYSNTTDYLVFEHRYDSPGTFVATVRVTTASGDVGTASCSFSWSSTLSSPTPAPAPRVFIPYAGNGGGPTLCADGSWSHSSGRGTCSYHGGEA